MLDTLQFWNSVLKKLSFYISKLYNIEKIQELQMF